MQLLVQRLLGVLGLLAAAAHAALPAVDTGLPAGAQCVSDYLAAVLRPPNCTLVVDGDVTLLADYLRDLAPGTPKVLRPPADEDETVGLRQTLTKSRALYLVVKRRGEKLLDFLLEKPGIFHLKQVLLWTWAPSPQDVLALTPSSRIWVCGGVLLHLAISTPNGTTFLYYPPKQGCHEPWQDIKMKENGRCSPGLRSWSKGSLPEPLCLEWKQNGSRKSPVQVVALEPPPDLRVISDLYKKYIENQVEAVGSKVELAWVPTNKTMSQVFVDAANCNLAALMYFFPVTVGVEPHLQYDTLHFVEVAVVVPAG
ncbi:Ionotropic receptor 219, partial [Frankliniella occidentalis]